MPECRCTEPWHLWLSHGARSTVDFAELHVTAFRPISKAARSWSYDNAGCCITPYTTYYSYKLMSILSNTQYQKDKPFWILMTSTKTKAFSLITFELSHALSDLRACLKLSILTRFGLCCCRPVEPNAVVPTSNEGSEVDGVLVLTILLYHCFWTWNDAYSCVVVFMTHVNAL